MSYKIDANTQNINQLSEIFYEVPDYQREYVWKSDEHVQRFLDDINDEFDPNSVNDSKYFIGSIIIVRNNNSDSIYDIIDGQQRITTIVLCLCSIRNIIEDINIDEQSVQDTKDGLLNTIKNLLFKYSVEENKSRPRLKLQYEDSKNFLEELIVNKQLIKDGSTKSIQRMYEAYTTIDEFFKSMSKDDPQQFLDFVRYFLSRVELVVIAPGSLSGALKIFETINERGVGLNAMDLLKNLLFASASKEDFDIIKEEWRRMTEYIDESGESDKPLRFLRYFLMSKYYDGVIRADNLYNWISSSKGKQRIGYDNNPKQFAKELNRYANKYKQYIKATIANSRDETHPNLTGIGHLLRKNSRQHIILLMALPESFSIESINKLAHALEVLSFYYANNRVLTKEYERQFALWASKIRGFETTFDLNEFIETELAPEISEQSRVFESNFGTKSLNGLLPQYRIKFILGEIDNYIRRSGNLSENDIMFYQRMEIEHILPQNPKNFKHDIYEDEYIYDNWAQRIGNVTLLESPINQTLAHANDLSDNEWFVRKKKEYKSSDIQLTKTLGGDFKIGKDSRYNQFVTNNLKSYQEWGPDQIEDRQEMLKKMMLNNWKL